MTLDETMAALAAKGSDATKTLWKKHGAMEPFFGVKIADLKVLHKAIKGDQALALKLYATRNGDAQYLAGMVADGRKMTTEQLQAWADTASWKMISGTIVPWVTSEHAEGVALALRWIEARQPRVVDAGWKTLAALVATVPDERLPLKALGDLLDRVGKTIARVPDEVRLAMNAFVIACGAYVAPLGEKALATARQVGRIDVDMGDTDCTVPAAEVSIMKARRGAPIAAKRKTVRC